MGLSTRAGSQLRRSGRCSRPARRAGPSGRRSTRSTLREGTQCGHHTARPPREEPLSMNDVTLYQFELCPYCQKVRAGLELKGIAFRAIQVNPMSKKELPGLPAGAPRKVPVLAIDGKLLWDSTDILAYLEEHVPGAVRFLPHDPATRAKTQQIRGLGRRRAHVRLADGHLRDLDRGGEGRPGHRADVELRLLSERDGARRRLARDARGLEAHPQEARPRGRSRLARARARPARGLARRAAVRLRRRGHPG